ncbi:MAG: hypothetical protein R3E97_22970 [Candidatus Eisenbacteria bacterium]
MEEATVTAVGTAVAVVAGATEAQVAADPVEAIVTGVAKVAEARGTVAGTVVAAGVTAIVRIVGVPVEAGTVPSGTVRRENAVKATVPMEGAPPGTGRRGIDRATGSGIVRAGAVQEVVPDAMTAFATDRAEAVREAVGVSGPSGPRWSGRRWAFR